MTSELEGFEPVYQTLRNISKFKPNQLNFCMINVNKQRYSFYIQDSLHQLPKPAPNCPSASITTRELYQK